jgi:hypothetical protein
VFLISGFLFLEIFWFASKVKIIIVNTGKVASEIQTKRIRIRKMFERILMQGRKNAVVWNANWQFCCA